MAVRSFDYKDVRSISDLNDALVQQVTEFLGLYNKNSGKQDEVKGVAGSPRAMKLLDEAIRRFKSKRCHLMLKLDPPQPQGIHNHRD